MLFSAARKVLNKIVNVASDFSDSETSGDVGESPSTSPGPMSNLLTKLKVAPPSPPPLELNPIMEFFDVGKETSSAGPELVWKVHDALRKSDGKECSVFFFDKRIPETLYKLKKKDVVLERIRGCIILLEKMRHPKMLQIIHSLEEGSHTFAFATEPVLASLHNILAWHDSVPVPAEAPPPLMPWPSSLECEERAVYIPGERPPDAKQYCFLDFELRYGLLQIIEALHFLHYKARQIHRNVCPHVIIVTKRGTWKLFGLEFVEDILGSDPTEMKAVAPWSVKLAMFMQPNLDFMAPETQTSGHVNILSDMFSLGLVICAVFNNGKYLLQCQNSQLLYLKQIQYLNQQVEELLVRIPVALQEAVGRMLSLDPHPRPTTQLLPLIKYFKFQIEVAIQAMQFLDEITMKDRDTKSEFYRVTLITALPVIPKKLRWQHIWPAINNEVRTGEVVAALITPITWFANDSTHEEFNEYVMPTLRKVIGGPKTILASVELLDNLPVILKKCNREHTNKDILPFLYHTMDSNTNQLQNASLVAAAAVSEYITDEVLLTTTLTKVKAILERNMNDVRVIKLVVAFFEKILHRLDRAQVLQHVIPTLLSMRLTDPGVVDKVVCLFRVMLSEPRLGLTSTVMATKMLPSLAPHTINPALSAEQFNHLMEIMYDMLDIIDKTQRAKLKLDSLAAAGEARRLRAHPSPDCVAALPFSIPNLRVAAQRKTSSAEDMARKNSVGAPPVVGTGSVGGFKGTGIGQWFFGSNNSGSDNNFLRVASIIPSRRLSDNTLLTPKIRVAPSCASSPGGTSGSASGLPTRRHSSIGPQERRGSAVNLSPPTGYRYRAGTRGGSGSSLSVPAGSQGAGGSMPNTSSSVPYLLTSSTGSVRGRRPSVALSGSQGSGLLSQISSGMSRHLPGGGGGVCGGGGPPPQHPARAGTPKQAQAPWQALQGATAAGYTALQNTAMAVKKCPSLNITLPR